MTEWPHDDANRWIAWVAFVFHEASAWFLLLAHNDYNLRVKNVELRERERRWCRRAQVLHRAAHKL